MHASNAQTIAAGTLLGGVYHLTRLMGQGGMGTVYEAMHQRLAKRVAVKVMARELAANDEALARFQQEAMITSQLGHPHLVGVMDFGLAESGEPYIVMEHLNGEDLERRLRRTGALPVEGAIQIAKQTASALYAAHSQGVVHRDLKPANIFLMQVPGEPDFVKVLDFGVSKVKAARTRITQVQSVIGTPNYMSPEQAMGMVDEIDPRADQWALACIVWEMFGGRPPFGAEDISALFYQILHVEPQPLSKLAPHLPTGVEDVLRRGLAKDPANRYPTIKDFYRDLESVTLQFPLDPTPPPMPMARLMEASRTPAPVPLPALAPPRTSSQLGSSTLDAAWGQARRRTATAIRVPARGSIRIAGKVVPWWALALPGAAILAIFAVLLLTSSRSPTIQPAPSSQATPLPRPTAIVPLEAPAPEIEQTPTAKKPPANAASTPRQRRPGTTATKPNPFGSKRWINPFDESGPAPAKAPAKQGSPSAPTGTKARKSSPFN